MKLWYETRQRIENALAVLNAVAATADDFRSVIVMSASEEISSAIDDAGIDDDHELQEKTEEQNGGEQ